MSSTRGEPGAAVGCAPNRNFSKLMREASLSTPETHAISTTDAGFEISQPGKIDGWQRRTWTVKKKNQANLSPKNKTTTNVKSQIHACMSVRRLSNSNVNKRINICSLNRNNVRWACHKGNSGNRTDNLRKWKVSIAVYNLNCTLFNTAVFSRISTIPIAVITTAILKKKHEMHWNDYTISIKIKATATKYKLKPNV